MSFSNAEQSSTLKRETKQQLSSFAEEKVEEEVRSVGTPFQQAGFKTAPLQEKSSVFNSNSKQETSFSSSSSHQQQQNSFSSQMSSSTSVQKSQQQTSMNSQSSSSSKSFSSSQSSNMVQKVSVSQSNR